MFAIDTLSRQVVVTFALCFSHIVARSVVAVATESPVRAEYVFYSLLPSIIGVSSWLIRFVEPFRSNLEIEHLARHVIFTVAFISAFGSVVWDDVHSVVWLYNLLLYACAGAISLTFFCVAHCFEIAQGESSCMNTHHGDVAVLPLTVAFICRVDGQVPVDTPYLPFSHAAIYFVPVLVGLSTLQFCAHMNFATRNVSTVSDKNNLAVQNAAALVSATLMVLLELHSPTILWAIFPLVAAIGMQLSTMQDSDRLEVTNRPARFLVVAAILAAFSTFVESVLAASGWLWWFWWSGALVIGATVGVEAVGKRWPLPIAMHQALIMQAITWALGTEMWMVVTRFVLFYASNVILQHQ